MLSNIKHHLNTLEALHNIDIPFNNQFFLSIIVLYQPLNSTIWTRTSWGEQEVVPFSCVTTRLGLAHVAAVLLGWYVWIHECLCMCQLSCLYRVATPFLFSIHFSVEVLKPGMRSGVVTTARQGTWTHRATHLRVALATASRGRWGVERQRLAAPCVVPGIRPVETW